MSRLFHIHFPETALVRFQNKVFGFAFFKKRMGWRGGTLP